MIPIIENGVIQYLELQKFNFVTAKRRRKWNNGLLVPEAIISLSLVFLISTHYRYLWSRGTGFK
jgi:hypothetical protein